MAESMHQHVRITKSRRLATFGHTLSVLGTVWRGAQRRATWKTTLLCV